MDRQEIPDAICLAALRGWCGWAPDADLSEVQTAPVTMEAWRRAIKAALAELDRGGGLGQGRDGEGVR